MYKIPDNVSSVSKNKKYIYIPIIALGSSMFMIRIKSLMIFYDYKSIMRLQYLIYR